MKKIFAIALALVMVLSMASAFASPCVTGPFDWTCSTSSTNCGKATIEVIGFVNTNAACNDNTYVVSDCAAAVNNENVYYAVKLTVDADVDPEWYAAAGKVEVDYTGLKAKDETIALPVLSKFVDESEDGWEFYLVYNSKAKKLEWVEATEDDDFDLQDVVRKTVVTEYAKAKVCAEFTSKNQFTKATVGDYTVKFLPEYKTVVTYKGADYDVYRSDAYKKGDNVTFWDEDANKEVVGTAKAASVVVDGNGWLIVTDDDNNEAIFYIVDEVITDIWANGTACKKAPAFVKEILEFLNLGCGWGVCVTKEALNANFGWKDVVKSCFTWKTNAQAIVDTECVVAIPKTGDASVLAWLF